MLYTTPSDATYKHRKFKGLPCPSWGDEGWTITPLSGYNRFQAPFTLDEGIVVIDLPDYPVEVKSIHIKVKSTLLMKRVFILEQSPKQVVLSNPGVITEDYVGGIVAIARYTTPHISFDSADNLEVDLVYQPDSDPRYPMCAIYKDGCPLKLNPNQLHSMNLVANWEGEKLPIQTAWVDPGFEGTLFVPFMDDCSATLSVLSSDYRGSNKYEGYKGNDRLYPKEPGKD